MSLKYEPASEPLYVPATVKNTTRYWFGGAKKRWYGEAWEAECMCAVPKRARI